MTWTELKVFMADRGSVKIKFVPMSAIALYCYFDSLVLSHSLGLGQRAKGSVNSSTSGAGSCERYCGQSSSRSP